MAKAVLPHTVHPAGPAVDSAPSRTSSKTRRSAASRAGTGVMRPLQATLAMTARPGHGGVQPTLSAARDHARPAGGRPACAGSSGGAHEALNASPRCEHPEAGIITSFPGTLAVSPPLQRPAARRRRLQLGLLLHQHLTRSPRQPLLEQVGAFCRGVAEDHRVGYSGCRQPRPRFPDSLPCLAWRRWLNALQRDLCPHW